jgi:hypothetical protein
VVACFGSALPSATPGWGQAAGAEAQSSWSWGAAPTSTNAWLAASDAAAAAASAAAGAAGGGGGGSGGGGGEEEGGEEGGGGGGGGSEEIDNEAHNAALLGAGGGELLVLFQAGAPEIRDNYSFRSATIAFAGPS